MHDEMSVGVYIICARSRGARSSSGRLIRDVERDLHGGQVGTACAMVVVLMLRRR